jgi:septal ring factor EnvC (AmiA/AmiB activator)
MNEAVLIAIVAATPGIAAAWFAYNRAVKAAEISSRNETMKIEADAYGRARKMYEAGIAQLEEQVARLRQQVGEEQDVSTRLRKQINELEVTVSKLRSQLARAGIELPAAKES